MAQALKRQAAVERQATLIAGAGILLVAFAGIAPERFPTFKVIPGLFGLMLLVGAFAFAVTRLRRGSVIRGYEHDLRVFLGTFELLTQELGSRNLKAFDAGQIANFVVGVLTRDALWVASARRMAKQLPDNGPARSSLWNAEHRLEVHHGMFSAFGFEIKPQEKYLEEAGSHDATAPA